MMRNSLITILCILASVSLTDAANYTYDKLDRLISVTYDNGKVVTYTYDNAGNILSTTVTIKK